MTSFLFPSNLTKKQSIAITNRLSKGEVITKRSYDGVSNSMLENKQFTTLFTNIDFYTEFFSHLGWNLSYKAEGEFFYLAKSENEQDEEGDASSLKVCLPLFFIAKNVVRKGLDLNILWATNVGLSGSDISEFKLSNLDDNIALQAIGYKGDVYEDAIKYLKGKSLVFTNNQNNIVFSSAAKYFVNQLIEKYADNEF